MKVTSVEDIREALRCLREGVSIRDTSETLGLARNTVRRYERRARELGWLDPVCSLPDTATVAEGLKDLIAGPVSTASRLAPFEEQIKTWRKAGMNIREIARRINEELRVACSYRPVWQFVTTLEKQAPEVFIRIETEPGEEAQVDFGSAGWMWDPEEKRLRKATFFCMTLSWSRHMFVRFVFDQSVPTWLALHVAAFEYFEGVPQRVRPDNLKAAVIKASFVDPLIQRSYRELAEHYGFLVSPCRVEMPRHKGKVESGVAYVKGTFLPGRAYASPACNVTHANVDALAWVEQQAGQRDHGTTHEPPLVRFERERPRLKALPEEAFEPAVWIDLKLGNDCHVVFEGSFYSAPFTYAEQYLSARVSAKRVELYAGYIRIATHARAHAPGDRKTEPSHLPPEPVKAMQAFASTRERAAEIGPSVARVVQLLLDTRGVDRRKAAAHVVGLAQQHGTRALEWACQKADELDDPSPQTVRNMLKLLASDPSLNAPPAAPQPRPIFARDMADLLPLTVRS